MPDLAPTYDARGVGRAIEDDIWPFVSRTPYTVSAKPDAADHPFRLIFLSNGAGNKYAAISNGSAWYYLDGSAV